MVNNANIDWFFPWPEQALYAVASVFISPDVSHSSLYKIGIKGSILWHKVMLNRKVWQKIDIKTVSTILFLDNYITFVFHWNITIWLVMKWSHDYKRDVSHPNETQIRTCTCLDVRCKQSMA